MAAGPRDLEAVAPPAADAAGLEQPKAPARGLLGRLRAAVGGGEGGEEGRVAKLGAYQAVTRYVYVGPGKGDVTLKGSQPVASAKADAVDGCINSPEQVAAGAGYFRRGVLCMSFFKFSVSCIVTLVCAGYLLMAWPTIGPQIMRWGLHARSSIPGMAPPREITSEKNFERSSCGPPPSFLAKGAEADSVEKRTWCCVRELIGCPEFDCDSDEASWSNTQTRWCCHYHGKGCNLLDENLQKTSS